MKAPGGAKPIARGLISSPIFVGRTFRFFPSTLVYHWRCSSVKYGWVRLWPLPPLKVGATLWVEGPTPRWPKGRLPDGQGTVSRRLPRATAVASSPSGRGHVASSPSGRGHAVQPNGVGPRARPAAGTATLAELVCRPAAVFSRPAAVFSRPTA